MRVFCFCIALLATLSAFAPSGQAGKAFSVVEQTTNQGTFYAYHDLAHPSWWFMAIPDVVYYAYNSQRMQFFARPAHKDDVYQINLLKRLDKLPAAQMKRQEITGVDIQGYNDLYQWQVNVYNRFCGSVIASQKAAERFNLNFVDQVRISQGLRTAFSQEIDRSKPCDDFHIPAVMGRLVGYGLALEGRGIKSDVTGIEVEGEKPDEFLTHKQIAGAVPLDDEGRKDLLLATLSPEERSEFEALSQDQSAKVVIGAIKARLSQSGSKTE